MRLLLDTVTFLWIANGSPQLSDEARQHFSDENNEVFLSVVSAWEICVKYAAGKLPLPTTPDQFISEQRISHRINTLPLHESAALDVYKLPSIHKDPFDRMLICQARAHDLVLLTPDPTVRAYPVKSAW